jgi:hypothetical protein
MRFGLSISQRTRTPVQLLFSFIGANMLAIMGLRVEANEKAFLMVHPKYRM